MDRQTQGSLVVVAALAGGIGFVIFVALMIIGGVRISPAIFLAILAAAGVAMFMLLRSGQDNESVHPESSAATGATATTHVSRDSAAETRTDPVTARSATNDADVTSGTGHDGADIPGTQPEPVADDSPDGGIGGEVPDVATDETPDSHAPKWKSTQLSGEQELAVRKGEWRYDGGDAVKTADPAAPAETAPPTETGSRPVPLVAPRDGGADDLKKIKGVGPKLEEMLHGLGIYHFDQIAHWSDDELAWIDAHLEGFKGRASRDEWIDQARTLSETENRA